MSVFFHHFPSFILTAKLIIHPRTSMNPTITAAAVRTAINQPEFE